MAEALDRRAYHIRQVSWLLDNRPLTLYFRRPCETPYFDDTIEWLVNLYHALLRVQRSVPAGLEGAINDILDSVRRLGAECRTLDKFSAPVFVTTCERFAAMYVELIRNEV